MEERLFALAGGCFLFGAGGINDRGRVVIDRQRVINDRERVVIDRNRVINERCCPPYKPNSIKP